MTKESRPSPFYHFSCPAWSWPSPSSKSPAATPWSCSAQTPSSSRGVAASHVHTIMGGAGFGFTMDYNQTQQARCSSCAPLADKSNYWIRTLYYQAENGSFTPVAQNGGALIYYLQREGPTNSTILAPPKDLRMIAGSPLDRRDKETIESQARSYACLDYSGAAKPETNGFPPYNCPDGLRTQVFFLSCWDGEHADSADHKSHMAYPCDAYNAGPCPASHPHKIASIFIEVIWHTEHLAGQWYGDGQPFVWSNGINGWDVPVLQEALDTFGDPGGDIANCAVLSLYEDAVTEGCFLEPSIDEQLTGWLDALPGCNPVQPGPADAKRMTHCDAPTAIDQSQHYYTDVTQELGWAWIGCARDNVNGARVLSASSSSADDMTVQKCIRTCEADGYTYAGVEYARECYCGDSIEPEMEPSDTVMGNCLSALYQACGSSCENLLYPAVPW
ncbi:hypothetical protein BDW62DRAFT_212992 [Aspergillus aurantiobrunneus]